MDTAAVPTEESLHALCAREHRNCFACRPVAAGGLGLVFHMTPEGGVIAAWDCPPGYESYDGVLHGGVIATVLDSAMVHALFAHGVTARTGSLNVRYRRAASAGGSFIVNAKLEQSHTPLFILHATLYDGQILCATAKGKFMADSSVLPEPAVPAETNRAPVP